MFARDAVAVTKSVNGEIRVVIGDRRRLIAEALAALIGELDGFTVTGVVADDEAVATVVAQQPDLALIGVGTDRTGAIELVRSLSSRAPGAEIVLVAEAVEPDLIRFVVDQQLSGLLLTDATGSDIGACLEQVAHGHAILPFGWRQALRSERNEALESLSGRQLQVLTLLADGCSYEEIAERLFITVNTVKFHVRSIFIRLGVRNRMAAARVLTKRTGSAQRPAGTGPGV